MPHRLGTSGHATFANIAYVIHDLHATTRKYTQANSCSNIYIVLLREGKFKPLDLTRLGSSRAVLIQNCFGSVLSETRRQA